MKTPQEMLDSLKGVEQYTDKKIVDTMPIYIEENMEGQIELFNIGRYVNNKELMEEYDKRGLVPVSPYLLIQEYGSNPPKDYVATVWDLKDEYLSFLAFGRWGDDERDVGVDRNDNVWDGHWWFAGLRKSSVSETKISSNSLTLELRIKKIEDWIRKEANFINPFE